MARAFFDTSSRPEEFAYIPDDLLALFPQAAGTDTPLMGRQASAAEYAQVFPANDRILDHTCTYLAALRVGICLPDSFHTPAGEELTGIFMKSILICRWTAG